MAKDPAILFYTSDFLTGTVLMSFEEKGMYITLLCIMHQKGRLTKDHMVTICGSYASNVFAQFQVDENGLYYNTRLEEEAEKRRKYSESRRKNSLKKNKDKAYGKPHGKHMDNHIVNVNDNVIVNKDVIVNESKNQKQKFLPPTELEIQTFFQAKGLGGQRAILEANKFWNFYESKGWLVGKNKMKKWKSAAANWFNSIKEQEYGTGKKQLTPDEARRIAKDI